MKLLMHILKKNDKLKIDNTKIRLSEILPKLEEEYEEVVRAIVIYVNYRTLLNLKEVIAETFDLIQMCILILWRCNSYAIELDEPKLIEDVNIAHKDKLTERAWIFETGIEIDIKE